MSNTNTDSAVKNILIVGVGGQGTILAARVLGELFTASGAEVKISEIHGMSQRGGSVVTHVRYCFGANGISSPIIERGTVDMILAFENLEALRYCDWLKKDGIMIVNDQQIDPMTVAAGDAVYPSNVRERLARRPLRLTMFDALSKAREAGNEKCVNVVLLGVLSRQMEMDVDIWRKALSVVISPRLLEVNLRAFDLGREIFSKPVRFGEGV